MRALFLLLFLITVSFGTVAAQSGCNELFFSEYLEGSTGNNKCVEIYNPTGSTVDLAAGAYKIQIYANGANTAGTTIALTGTVPAYGTYVVCNTGATLAASDDQSAGNLSHTGNDAVVLVKGAGNTILDIFGVIDDDPAGGAWTSGALSTANQVLRRKSSVQGGVTVNPIGTGPSAFTTLGTEWDNFIDTDYSGFGTHTSTCVPTTACSIDGVNVTLESSCNDNGTPLNSNDDYVEVDVTIDYTSKPGTGNLVLSGDITYSIGVGSIGATSHNATGFTVPADGTPIQVTATFSDDPSCTLTVNNVTAPMPCSVAPNCGAPFFSEYVEGGTPPTGAGNNKCLEIYNPTASPIDLAAGGYQIEMYFNGSSGIGLTLNLTGVIQPGDVYVVCNTGATADFTAQADQLGGGGWFNGDDAIVLRNTSGIIDVIGQIGVDPGTEWSNSGVSTLDQTLRRFSFVQKGDNNGSDAFDPSLEWQSYPRNTFWGLGYHATACQPSLPSGWNPFNTGCPTGTVSHNAGQWTLTSNCYEDMSSGRDDVTLAFQELCGDGEIITRICGITGLGYAGLTFRESASANSKFVALTIQNSQIARWNIRSATGGVVQSQFKLRGGRNWLRVARTGTAFRGYLSHDGINWQLLFASSVPMGECMLVGLVTESNVDGATTTTNFCNVNLIDPTFLVRPFDNSPAQMNEQLSHQGDNGLALPEGTELFDSNEDGGELSIRPNPVVNELEVVLPDHLQPGALLHLVDLNGKKLFSERIGEGANLMRLNLAQLNLSAGVYLLHIQDGATVLTKRFVKVN